MRPERAAMLEQARLKAEGDALKETNAALMAENSELKKENEELKKLAESKTGRGSFGEGEQ